MTTHHDTLELSTEADVDILDVTEAIQAIVVESGIAPRDGRYLHEEIRHDDNGHSHVRASLIGPSLALPVVDGTIPLGTWQQVVLVDLDTRPRRRRVGVTVLGS